MSASEFCVVCGRTGRPLLDGLCGDCAADRTPLVTVPAHAEVVVCPTCGARLSGRHWGPPGGASLITAEDLAPFLTIHPDAGVRSVRWEETKGTATTRELLGTARVRFRDVEREVPLRLSARLVHRTCPDCSRRSGRYYTAIVQLRGSGDDRTERGRPLRERLAAVWQELLRDARPEWVRACAWREELPEGWDCFFTDTLAARAVARLAKQRFGVRIVESASLYGRKDGQDLYRVTFCVRFPRGVGAPASRAASAGDPLQP